VKQLIVNADDFGLTENVNRGILDAHRQGIVTSTTLLSEWNGIRSCCCSEHAVSSTRCRSAPQSH
jgi:predicted glycoside hydrolase/deacetylase ChbG (UPF0249 family)